MTDNVVSRATAALKESVASIVGCDDDDATKAYALAESFDQFEAYLEKAVAGGGDRENGDGDRAGGGGLANHPVVQLARLLVASGKFGDHAQAFDHLLNTPRGVALVRTHKAATEKESNNMDTLTSIMKSGGIGATCAAIVAKGATNISEHELVEAASAVAHDRHPELSPAQAFSKVYADQGDEGRLLREAISVAKQPVISGADLRDAADADQAMDQLREIGRRMAPTATAEKQFSLAFSANPLLAARAHRRPSPTTFFQPPR
jgi:hypothetical protein